MKTKFASISILLFVASASWAVADTIPSSFEACLATLKNCSPNENANLQDSLRAICETSKRRKNCDALMVKASANDKGKFTSCSDPETLCSSVSEQKLARLYSCGKGIGGVIVDQIRAIRYIPESTLALVSKLPSIPGIITECQNNDAAKVAYMGELRPKGMLESSIRNLSCSEIKKITDLKVSALLASIEQRRQDEIIRRGVADLSIDDLKLSQAEQQALSFSKSKMGILAQADCYSPQEQAAVSCAQIAKTSLAFSAGIGGVRLLRTLTSVAETAEATEVIGAKAATSVAAASKFNLKSVNDFYRETGYYPGPLDGKFASSYKTLDIQKTADGLSWSRPEKLLTELGEGNNAVVYRGDNGHVYKIASRPEKMPALLAEQKINLDLKENFSRYGIKTDAIQEVGENGTYLRKPFLDPTRLAENMETLTPKQVSQLEKMFDHAKLYSKEKGIGLDLKASNLFWDGSDWVLFDCGPRMGFRPYGFTLDVDNFQQYQKIWRGFDPPEPVGRASLTLKEMQDKLAQESH